MYIISYNDKSYVSNFFGKMSSTRDTILKAMIPYKYSFRFFFIGWGISVSSQSDFLSPLHCFKVEKFFRKYIAFFYRKIFVIVFLIFFCFSLYFIVSLLSSAYILYNFFIFCLRI